MSDKSIISVDVNPLRIESIEAIPLKTLTVEEQTPEAILNVACRRGYASDFDSIKLRYQEICSRDEIKVVPNVEQFLEKIIRPMRDAKSCYMLGNNFGTISISGMVTEMVTNILYQSWKIADSKRNFSNADEETLYGNKFDRLSQIRKLKLLRLSNVLDEDSFKLFDAVRNTRNRYIHGLDIDWSNIQTDAITIYANAILCIKFLTKETFSGDGTVQFSKDFLTYLVSEGFVIEKVD